MVSSVSANYSSLSVTYTQQATQTQSVSSVGGGDCHDCDKSVGGTAAVGTDSAKISSPGKLFSQLQQLQASDPTKLKQLLTDISSQLQSAAQQASGTNPGNFLSQLADKFQTAASTGDLSGLQPHRSHGHHHAHPEGTYNVNGHVAQPSLPDANAATGVTASTGVLDIGKLFGDISKEVAQAVGA